MTKIRNREELRGRIGGKEKRKERKLRGEEKREIGVKRENSPYFVSLFNIGPYDRQKSPKKTGKTSIHFKGEGGGRLAIRHTPDLCNGKGLFLHIESFKK